MSSVLVTASRTATASPTSQALRAACYVQAVALLCALLALAAVDHVFGVGLACLGLGAAASAVAWRITRG